MPRVSTKKRAARKPGRPAGSVGRPYAREGAEHRLDLRRRKASTSLRVTDRDLVLFQKLATKWGVPLPEAFSQLVSAAAGRARVVVAQDPNADLGWS